MKRVQMLGSDPSRCEARADRLPEQKSATSGLGA